MIIKFNVGLKMLLREGLSESDKLKKLIGKNDFSFHLEKSLYVC